jgi:CheY-like chemotaxis protein
VTSEPQTPVLIVDDDVPTQMLLQALLRRYGHPTEVAVNGADAIVKLQQRDYSLIILDLMMPNVSGTDVIDALRASGRKTPVILCTAAGPAHTATIDFEIVRAVIRKPFEIAELAETVASLTGGVPPPPPSVLIVDDDARARYVMRAFLEPTVVREAETGAEALESIRESRPDVVFLDLVLPGMPGEDVLRKLRETIATRNLPVVVVTSRKLDGEDRARLLVHASAVIYKGDLSRTTIHDALLTIKAR